jgi:hypothetical protein
MLNLLAEAGVHVLQIEDDIAHTMARCPRLVAGLASNWLR